MHLDADRKLFLLADMDRCDKAIIYIFFYFIAHVAMNKHKPINQQTFHTSISRLSTQQNWTQNSYTKQKRLDHTVESPAASTVTGSRVVRCERECIEQSRIFNRNTQTCDYMESTLTDTNLVLSWSTLRYRNKKADISPRHSRSRVINLRL